MSVTQIRFGTDGWRAIIAEDYTFANVRYCAEGTARYLKAAGLAGRGVVIGFDTRFSSAEFAAAAAEVMAAHGLKVHLCDRAAPTPVACHAVIERKAGGAVIITASHNPAAYNGFKFKPDYGGSAPPAVVDELERQIGLVQQDAPPRRLKLAQAMTEGLVECFNPREAYDRHVARLIDLGRIRAAGIDVLVDAMHATGAGILTELLAGGQTRVTEIRAEANPAFPGLTAPEPIARNLAPLMAAVSERRASVGLATDGDADRLGLVDEAGGFVDQLKTFALLSYYLLEYAGERGPLVRSITSTRMIDRLGALYAVPVHETPVGFKYLGPKMMETGAITAGEESGGYAFGRHLPERDGCFAGLLILDLMACSGKTLSQLLQEMFAKVGEHFYDRLDVHLEPGQREQAIARVAAARPDVIAGRKVLRKDAIDGFRFELDGGWLLVRPSGTEPLLRIYTELTDASLVRPVLDAGRELAGV